MLYIFSFILGIIFWSFASALVRRIGTKTPGLTTGRSKCTSCNTELWVLDLVPVFSWLFLKWKCRYCKRKVSIIYPLLEIMMGIFFVLGTYFVFAYNGFTWDFLDSLFFLQEHIAVFLYVWILSFLMVCIIVYDFEFYEIHEVFWFLSIAFIFIPQFFGWFGDLKIAMISAVIWFAFIMAVRYGRYWLKWVEWMWWWDAFGAFLIGLYVPVIADFHNLKSFEEIGYVVFIVLFSGFFVWLIASFIQIAFGKLTDSQSAIPFLPYMIFGLVISIFASGYIVKLLTNGF